MKSEGGRALVVGDMWRCLRGKIPPACEELGWPAEGTVAMRRARQERPTGQCGAEGRAGTSCSHWARAQTRTTSTAHQHMASLGRVLLQSRKKTAPPADSAPGHRPPLVLGEQQCHHLGGILLGCDRPGHVLGDCHGNDGGGKVRRLVGGEASPNKRYKRGGNLGSSRRRRNGWNDCNGGDGQQRGGLHWRRGLNRKGGRRT